MLQFLNTWVNAGGYYHDITSDDMLQVDDVREYWKQWEIWGITFRYQIGAGGYFIDNTDLVQLSFDEPFSGTLKQIPIKGSNAYSREIPEIYSYDFVNARDIAIELRNGLRYEMELILEFQDETFKLWSINELFPSGFIYSDSQYNQLYKWFLLTRDLNHLQNITDRIVIIDKKLDQDEYLQVIEFMITNKIIINEEKNLEFIEYVFWENYWDYKAQKTAYIRLQEYDTTGLKVVERENRYNEKKEKYVEISYYKYELWEISFTVLLEDRQKYIDAGIPTWSILFDDDYRNGDDFIFESSSSTINYDGFSGREIFQTEEIKSKYANSYLLIWVMIVYLWVVLAFYFLYHKRLKKRSTIIYFSIINAIIFFSIYFIWYKILLWNQNLSYSTNLYVEYPNFTLHKEYDYDFAVKRTIYTKDFTNEFEVDVYTNDSINRTVIRWENATGMGEFLPHYRYNGQYTVSPLRNIFSKSYELIETTPDNISGEVIDFDNKEEFMELPRPVKFLAKKYIWSMIQYSVNESQWEDEIKKNYIITVDLTNDRN